MPACSSKTSNGNSSNMRRLYIICRSTSKNREGKRPRAVPGKNQVGISLDGRNSDHSVEHRHELVPDEPYSLFAARDFAISAVTSLVLPQRLQSLIRRR
jgi:hypothetical protein